MLNEWMNECIGTFQKWFVCRRAKVEIRIEWEKTKLWTNRIFGMGGISENNSKCFAHKIRLESIYNHKSILILIRNLNSLNISLRPPNYTHLIITLKQSWACNIFESTTHSHSHYCLFIWLVILKKQNFHQAGST